MIPAFNRPKTRVISLRILLSLFVPLLVAAPARAQEWTSYAYPNDIRDITRVENNLWMATTGGALRYDLDSGQFEQLTRRASGGPLSQLLVSATFDPVSGLLFFGTEDLGVSQYDPAADRWERFEFLPDNRINGISALDGEVQIGTLAGFAIRRSATRTDICNEIDRGCCGPDPNRCDFPSFDVRDWASPAADRLWAATAAGPAEFDGVAWRPRLLASLLDCRTIEAIDGQVFAAGPGVKELFRWDVESSSWIQASAGLRTQGLGSSVRLVSSGGSLYLCCNYGLFLWNGESWVGTGIEDRDIRSVVAVNRPDIDLACAARDGILLRRLVGPTTEWVQKVADGPPQNIATQAVAGAPDGTLWIGTLGGVMGQGPDKTWVSLRNDTPGGLSRFDVFSIQAARDNKLWVGKCCCREMPNCPTQFIDTSAEVSPVLSAFDGWAMSEDGTGRFWIGSNSTGLTLLAADGTHLVDVPPASGGLASSSVRALATRNNDVWVGHEERGLQILRHGGNPTNTAGYQWKTFTAGQIPDPAVIAIELRDRDAYVLTSTSLVQYTDEVRVRQWPLNFDGEPRRGSGLAIDRRGNRWVGTSAGILLIDTAGETSLLTTSNSDIIADEIIDVDLDPKNGHVLFATRLGVSRLVPGTGSNPGGADGRYLFPNPFRPDSGVRVKVGGGTADNAEVMDLVGRPIARFDPAVGWDGTALDGTTVAPGIYLVLLDGTESLRLAVLR